MLTHEEGTKLAQLLKKAKWPLPLDAFLAFLETNIAAGADLALIRDGLPSEVLLTKRPSSDPFFAGLWHIPGGIVMPGETALSTLTKRMLKADVGIELSGKPELLTARDIMKGPPGPHTNPRGQEVYRCFHYVLRFDDPEVSMSETRQFFPLDNIPYAFLQHQLPSIEKLREVHLA